MRKLQEKKNTTKENVIPPELLKFDLEELNKAFDQMLSEFANNKSFENLKNENLVSSSTLSSTSTSSFLPSRPSISSSNPTKLPLPLSLSPSSTPSTSTEASSSPSSSSLSLSPLNSHFRQIPIPSISTTVPSLLNNPPLSLTNTLSTIGNAHFSNGLLNQNIANNLKQNLSNSIGLNTSGRDGNLFSLTNNNVGSPLSLINGGGGLGGLGGLGGIGGIPGGLGGLGGIGGSLGGIGGSLSNLGNETLLLNSAGLSNNVITNGLTSSLKQGAGLVTSGLKNIPITGSNLHNTILSNTNTPKIDTDTISNIPLISTMKDLDQKDRKDNDITENELGLEMEMEMEIKNLNNNSVSSILENINGGGVTTGILSNLPGANLFSNTAGVLTSSGGIGNGALVGAIGGNGGGGLLQKTVASMNPIQSLSINNNGLEHNLISNGGGYGLINNEIKSALGNGKIFDGLSNIGNLIHGEGLAGGVGNVIGSIGNTFGM